MKTKLLLLAFTCFGTALPALDRALTSQPDSPRATTTKGTGDTTPHETLGRRLKRLPGWKFHAVMLEKDLVLLSDIGNTYDLAGDHFSNYEP
jgi:hypothetical protein